MTAKAFTVPRTLFDHPQWTMLTPLSKGFLLALYGEVDSYGIVPSVKAGKTSELWAYHLETVMEITFELREKGLIELYEVEGDEYMQISNYDDHLSGLQLKRRSTKWPHRVDIMSTSCRQPVDTVSTPRRHHVDKDVTPVVQVSKISENAAENAAEKHIEDICNISIKTKETSNTRLTRADHLWNKDELFGIFWKDYYTTARRFGANAGSKKEAWDIWRKLSLGPISSEIMAGLSNWKVSKDWSDGRIRHAVRWLKARMWEDDPPPKNASGNKDHFKPTTFTVVLDESEVPF